jgi:hypothetical protein
LETIQKEQMMEEEINHVRREIWENIALERQLLGSRLGRA